MTTRLRRQDHPTGGGAGRLARSVAAVVALVLLVACGEDRTALDARLADGQAAFEAGDLSGATRVARELLGTHGEDAAVRRLAAVTAFARGDLDEALEHAEAGLLVAAPDAADLRGALHFVAGSAAGKRYGELRDARDWGLANSHLEDATTAGRQRVDAAHRLVRMHATSDPRADRKRLLRFARVVVSLAPDGEAAADVRRVVDELGLSL